MRGDGGGGVLVTTPDHRLRFAAAVSYRSASAEGIARQKRAIFAAVDAGLDPDGMIGLIERHRVWGLALVVLQDTGMEACLEGRLDSLRRSVTEMRRKGLVLAMRGEQARRAIEASGVRCIDFKGGPNLSRKLYGDIASRHCKDVDLMVHPEDLRVAAEALRRDGWRVELPGIWFSSPLHRALSRYCLRDIHVHDSVADCMVELHNRFEDIPDPRLERVWWNAMDSADSRILSEIEFLYLVHHGTRHLWDRLKWLGDMARIADAHPDLVERSRPMARELGLERMFGPLSVLLRDLYDIELPGYPCPTDADRALAAACFTASTNPDMSRFDPFEHAAHMRPRRRFQYALFGPRVPFLRRGLVHIVSFLFRAKDIEALGPYLWVLLPLLPLVRLASVAWRYALHGLRIMAGRIRP